MPRTSAASAPTQPRRQRRPRGYLDIEDIIDGAFELADEVSLSKLSMPMLAKHLDVPITSIYWHFRKKDDLLDAMTHRAVKEYHFNMPFVDPTETWQEGLRKHFLEMRRVFREKPVLCDLILMRTGELDADTMQESLKNLEAAVGTLVEAGFAPADALDLYMTLSLHIRGVAVLERLDTAGTARDISRIPSAEHTPLLHDLALRGHLPVSTTDASFLATVNAIINQAEQLLAKGPGTRRAKATSR
ncbi:TetR family transcriptional regulator [Mycolicibacter heraklionensis]|uniref:TetR family transcriptional regulator n=1 Tax=Mycolicibacter heraklionensis TaxID=512402 RepID=A0ABR5FFG6_9MYCO|nr:TetR family transcriptional regulator [Mycolicibacter heraklionensis]KLO28773.1 TetR family transcriptional regulator [Mycolicibacter heraklionensis]